jgi:integrase
LSLKLVLESFIYKGLIDFMANSEEQLSAVVDSKSVRKMSEGTAVKKVFGKGDARYWQQEGKLFRDKRWGRFLCCKIQVLSHRDSFPLRTANKAEAAARAARIYLDVVALGWPAALAKHKPKSLKSKRAATVGTLIEASTRLSSARRESLDTYAKALRRIAAGVTGLASGRKYDFTKGSAEWREKVDAVPLEKLTPASVLAWKNSFLKTSKTSTAGDSASVTVNSLIRNSKALVGKKVRSFIADEIELPAALWFEGILSEKEPNLRYRSKIDAATLIAAARDELAENKPEAFKLFLLTLVCGLRRSEADSLLWEQVDFEKAVIHIRDNRFKRLKSSDSAGEIGMDAELVVILRAFHSCTNGLFVLATPTLARKAASDLTRRGYRCEATHQSLLEWLRDHGVEGLRPIHTLRKEIGSIIASKEGIFKASRYLRHSDIRITNRLYADTKSPVCAGLGALLGS